MKLVAILATITTLIFGCVAPEYVETNHDSTRADERATERTSMGLVAVGPAPGGPFATIDCPDDGNPATAEDHRREVAALLRNWQLQGADITALQNDKVDRAGDTMTDLLTVNASTTNEYAVRANGNGNGGGIRARGGVTGPGGVFLGGVSGGNAIEATGTGSGYAAILGGPASSPTSPKLTVQIQSGGLELVGTSPNANVDPGADGTVWPQSINSSSCTIDTDGAGNATVSANGFNVNTVSIFGLNTLVVAFKRALPGAAYRVALGEYGPYKVELINGSRTTAGYQLKVRDLATNLYVNLTTTPVTVFVTTTGF